MTSTAPSAKTIVKQTSLHGDELVDHYFWLREKASPDVIAYLEAENAYTDAVMKPTEPLQEALYQEMLARIKETDVEVPYREGGYFYYTRTEQGKQYPIYARKWGSLDAEEEITIDLNALAEGKPFTALGSYKVSRDGRMLAYSIDTTGFREYNLQIKDLESGQLLPDRLGKVTQVVWANDNKTLFYVTEDSAKRAYRVYRHVLGADAADDTLVYEETDKLYRVGIGRTRSRGYIFIGAVSFTTSEYRYVSADRPAEPFTVMAERRPNVEYHPDHHGDRFYIRINDTGRNFRLVTAPVSDQRRETWEEIVPHRDDVMLEGTDLFTSHLVVSERENGLPKFHVTNLKTGQSHAVSFPEPAYSAAIGQNAEFDTTTLRFTYESFITPQSTFDYEMDTKQRTLLKQKPVLGGYDPEQYVSERISATAPDGVPIPVSIVYRRGLERNGLAPMLLYGYGSYGIVSAVSFQSARLSLLDRGVTFAIAHVRGGGEMGKPWHDQGRLMNKKNTFTDFIAVAEHLIAEGYTSKDHLAVRGGSAGGLLLGAVVNLRPDLFKVVVSIVPFVDVINTMLDESLPLTVGEYLEWGNPSDEEAYHYIKSYSPYDNLEAKAYPTTLVKTSLNDSQVMFWEPAKYVAKLRTLKTDDNPLLLKTNMAAGHAGASGRYEALRETSFEYAFILTQLGVEGPRG